MRVEKVSIFSRIPQLRMKTTIRVHFTSIVSSIKHFRVVANPIQVSVEHLHDVAFTTRLRVMSILTSYRKTDHRNDHFLSNQFRWGRYLCSACTWCLPPLCYEFQSLNEWRAEVTSKQKMYWQTRLGTDLLVGFSNPFAIFSSSEPVLWKREWSTLDLNPSPLIRANTWAS